MDPPTESNAKLGAEDSGHLRSQNEGSVVNTEPDPLDTTRRRRRVISFPKVARSSTGFMLNQRHTVNYEDCVTSPFEQEEEEYEDEDSDWVERERVSRQLDEVFSKGADYATITRGPTQRRNSRLTFFTTKSGTEDNPWERDDDLNLDYDSDTYEYHDPWYSSTITNGKFARGGQIADVYDELSGNGIRYCERKKKERRPTSWYGRFFLCRWVLDVYDRGWMLHVVIVIMTVAFGFLSSICSRLCPDNACRVNDINNIGSL
ncbi:Protein of unknown function [Pyronema omphalodes CBS 100304]|uniref:Uncharacterized protein n=1 Tax=Pyronema omphalodes (strain CBS 100304) TaxID=1076935 RepID=U4LS62_PYROM|nr:Protein of unknown function [Pyronema omphalodes CBS 100304]